MTARPVAALAGALALWLCASGAARPAPVHVPAPPPLRVNAGTPAGAPVGPARLPAGLDDDFDALLHADVRGGAPDWEVLRRLDLPRLEAYLDRLARVDERALPAAERTAFRINLYNAAFLRLATPLSNGPWPPSRGDFAILRESAVRRPWGAISLDSLQRLVRADSRDTRVLVALWCGARSCPPLAPGAYRGADLDAMLAARMRAFVRDPAFNRVDRGRRTLRLSRVFDWYAADFGGPAGVSAAVGYAAGEDVRGWTVTFQDYDWRLAAARAR
jgi:hypothetical protein